MNDISRERRLLQLLEDVDGMPSDQRRAYLNKACAGDKKLRARAEHLLNKWDEKQNSPFKFGTEKSAQHLVGSDLGPYTLLRKLGEGGMGTVYLAHESQRMRDVAVKFIRFGRFASEMERYRFNIEQKSLRSLSHPNIVTIMDTGILDKSRPYFVMEYVEGLPIVEYCNNENLSLRDRIELIIQIAAAVHYAHNNMIVHRDLKPGNILVKQDGTPKLLDFGIAKLLDDPSVYTTATGMRVMTLEYAAPEQIDGSTTSTSIDVYALGVILYELLSGVSPF